MDQDDLSTLERFEALIYDTIIGWFTEVGAAFSAFASKIAAWIESIPGSIFRNWPLNLVFALVEIVTRLFEIIDDLLNDLQNAPFNALLTALQAMPPIRFQRGRQRTLTGEAYVNLTVSNIVRYARDMVAFNVGSQSYKRMHKLATAPGLKRFIESLLNFKYFGKGLADLVVRIIIFLFKAFAFICTMMFLLMFLLDVFDPVTWRKWHEPWMLGQRKKRFRLEGPYRTRKP